MEVKEVKSNLDIGKSIKERMDIFLEDVNKIYFVAMASYMLSVDQMDRVKSSLLLNMFKSLKYYSKKFDNILFNVILVISAKASICKALKDISRTNN